MAQELEDQDARSCWLGLTEVRIAFDDALWTSDSAVEGMGDEKLRPIARELVDSIYKNLSIG